MELASLLVFLLIVGIISFTQFLTKYISITQPTILGFYSIVFFVMMLGLLPLEETQSFKERIGYENLLYALLLHIFFILLPYLICYSANFGKLRQTANNFRRADIEEARNEKKIFFILLLLVTLVFVHQLLYLPSIPIFLIFQNFSGEEVALSREQAFKLNDNAFVYLWHFNRMIFSPLLVLSAFLIFSRETNERAKWGILFFVATTIACINSSLSSALAPVAMIFLMLFLLRNYVKKSFSFLNSAWMFLVVLSFPIFIEFLFSDGDFLASASNTIYKVFKRFSLETFDRTLVYFDLFPHQLNYLGGSTNRMFTIITGNDFFNVQNFAFLYYVESVMGDQLREHLMFGSLNANFIAYMNADFGIFGVAMSSFFMGCILTFFEFQVMRLKKNIFVLSLYIMLMILFWKMMGTQPASILVGHGGIAMLVMAVGLAWVGDRKFHWRIGHGSGRALR